MRKKQYQICNNSINPVREIDIDGHRVEVNKRGEGWVYDKGLADEIDARYGPHARTETANKVIINEVDDSDPTREPGHRYTFTVPDLSRFKGYPQRDR